jgi:hypothetical protein
VASAFALATLKDYMTALLSISTVMHSEMMSAFPKVNSLGSS